MKSFLYLSKNNIKEIFKFKFQFLLIIFIIFCIFSIFGGVYAFLNFTNTNYNNLKYTTNLNDFFINDDGDFFKNRKSTSEATIKYINNVIKELETKIPNIQNIMNIINKNWNLNLKMSLILFLVKYIKPFIFTSLFL